MNWWQPSINGGWWLVVARRRPEPDRGNDLVLSYDVDSFAGTGPQRSAPACRLRFIIAPLRR